LQSKGLQESSPAPHFESINSSALSLPYGPTLTSIYNYWKNHRFDYADLYYYSILAWRIHGLCSPWDRKELDMTERLSLHFKYILKSKDILFNTGNYIQYLIITYNRKETEKEDIYIYTYMYN